MRVLLVSSYELGHQPLQVAAPAAKLRDAGHDVRVVDLAVESWDPALAAWADRVAFSVPMHTATRIARQALLALRAARPEVPVAAYGLYAAMLADSVDAALVGETDDALLAWVDRAWVDGEPARPTVTAVHLGREAARSGAPRPARDLLPPLDRYATLLVDSEARTAGYVEASHGCSHRCRHCPVPVVYDGRLRVVDVDAVLADAAQQVEAGARHLTFGDPDFLNGAAHSMRVVRALHTEYPDVTFDVTAKVEHIVAHEDLWRELAQSGCLFVVSAFESVDDETLAILDKGHTTADASNAVSILRRHGITVRPSWMPFVPWTRGEHVHALLDFVAEHDLVSAVDPVQYTIRLLLPHGSLLLTEPRVISAIDGEDADLGTFTWRSDDASMDELHAAFGGVVEAGTAAGDSIPAIYDAVRRAAGLAPLELAGDDAVPRLSEAWFCCAEPTAAQLELARRP
jgi:radical SAM superfamily enzyme YgiQ (UPF0313 family)